LAAIASLTVDAMQTASFTASALTAAFTALVNELVRNRAQRRLSVADVVTAFGTGTGEPGRMQ
jgi:hypothetical protein